MNPMILSKVKISFPLEIWGVNFTNWVIKTYKALSPEPNFQFSQTRPPFNQNFNTNLMNVLKVKISIHLGICGY